jgi:CubicO group peptidase (beta-lactamase class C family)
MARRHRATVSFTPRPPTRGFISQWRTPPSQTDISERMLWLAALVNLSNGAELSASGQMSRLIDDTQTHGTTALIIQQRGHDLVRWYSSNGHRPTQLMSCTKSVAALVVGILIDDGRIASLDLPLTTWFPEAAGTAQGTITLRQVMSATTGLEPCSDTRTCPALYRKDAVGFALSSPVVQQAGTWAYSNNAPNLISGIVENLSDMTLDEFARLRLFEPLGITSARWERDASGHTRVEAGLSMSPDDFLHVGDLLMADGVWHGTRIISSESLHLLTTPQAHNPWNALLWWPVYRMQNGVSTRLIEFWRLFNMPEDLVARLEPLTGTHWATLRECLDAEAAALGPGATGHALLGRMMFTNAFVCDGTRDLMGYAAEGYLGQYLVVLPEYGIVAVRMRRVGKVYSEHGDDDPRDLSRWPEDLAEAAAQTAP